MAILAKPICRPRPPSDGPIENPCECHHNNQIEHSFTDYERQRIASGRDIAQKHPLMQNPEFEKADRDLSTP